MSIAQFKGELKRIGLRARKAAGQEYYDISRNEEWLCCVKTMEIALFKTIGDCVVLRNSLEMP